MKKLLILFVLVATLPLGALNAPTPPIEEPVLQVYSANRSQNARSAIQLGYANFQRRVNTQEMTPTDIKIALFVHTKLRPFLEKISIWETMPDEQKAPLRQNYSDELVELTQQLSQLLLKNQSRYINPLLLNDQAALDETLRIVYNSIQQGHL